MNDNLINTEIVFQIPSINRIFSFECDINMTTLHELRQMVSLLSHLPIYDILIYSSEINIDMKMSINHLTIFSKKVISFLKTTLSFVSSMLIKLRTFSLPVNGKLLRFSLLIN